MRTRMRTLTTFCEKKKLIIIVVWYSLREWTTTLRHYTKWNGNMNKNMILLPDYLDADISDATSNDITRIQCWPFCNMCAFVHRDATIIIANIWMNTETGCHTANSIAFKITWIEQQWLLINAHKWSIAHPYRSEHLCERKIICNSATNPWLSQSIYFHSKVGIEMCGKF